MLYVGCCNLVEAQTRDALTQNEALRIPVHNQHSTPANLTKVLSEWDQYTTQRLFFNECH